VNLHGDIAATEDLPHDAPAIPQWSESYAFWAWDHAQDMTVYAHFQRHPDKPAIWRGYCAVIKGDQVYALHSYGRQRSPFGPGFESCHMICEEPHRLWRLRADGAGQQRSVDQLFQRAIDDGPAVPLSVDLQLSCRTPVWGLRHGTAGVETIMPAHYEQKGRIIGTVEIGDVRYPLNCLGANDHSHGVRNLASLAEGSMFFNGAFPSGRSFTGIQMGPGKHVGYIYPGEGQIRQASRVVAPTSGWQAGDKGKLIVEADTLTAEIHYEITRRRLPLTMVAPNFEHVGLVHGDQTPLSYYELSCKLEWDGESGAGSWEPARIKT